MKIGTIREALNAIVVHHPNYVALGPKGRTVIVYQPDESYKVLDTLLISEIEHGAKKSGGR